MSVISLGRRYTNDRGDPPVAVVRNYTFQESTYPVEPTIVTAVTVTEHTMHFGWTNPEYFQASIHKNFVLISLMGPSLYCGSYKIRLEATSDHFKFNLQLMDTHV